MLISYLDISIDEDAHDAGHVQYGCCSEWILNEPLGEIPKETHGSAMPQQRVSDSEADTVLCPLSEVATCACRSGVQWLFSHNLLFWTMRRGHAFSLSHTSQNLTSRQYSGA